MPDRSPGSLWETALGQLELQVTRPNFETWLRNTAGLRLEGAELVVGVPSDFALEWLRSRMSSLINRTVSQLLGTQVTVSFQVLGAQVATPPPNANSQTPSQSLAGPVFRLDPRLTFETFTVVKSNRLAYRAARRIASGDIGYNPLILSGPPGLGKTHLLHATGHPVALAGGRVVALTGEAFVDQYAKTVRAGHPHTFRDLFDDCRLFLLDDLGFLATRAASQEQFFHLFNTLLAAGCAIVATLEAHPERLSGLSPRLRSRLLAGLSIELHCPSQGERLEILRLKAAALRHPLPEAVLLLIAEHPCENVRELEGALNRVAALAEATDSSLSPDTVRRALSPFRQASASPSPNAVLDAVCRHFQLTSDQLAGASRARDITYARHIAMYLLRQHGSQSLADIGRLFGGRDHSTVLNAHHRISQELASLPQTQADIDRLETVLKSASAA